MCIRDRIKAHLAQYGRLKQAGGVDRNQLQLGSGLRQNDARRVFLDWAEVALKNKEYELLLFPVSYTHLDVYKRQGVELLGGDAHLTAKAELSAVGEAGGAVDSSCRHSRNDK